MNYAIFKILLKAMADTLAAASDGDITVEEAINIIIGIIAGFGIGPLTKDDFISVETIDGGLLIKIGAPLLKNLSYKLNVE